MAKVDHEERRRFHEEAWNKTSEGEDEAYHSILANWHNDKLSGMDTQKASARAVDDLRAVRGYLDRARITGSRVSIHEGNVRGVEKAVKELQAGKHGHPKVTHKAATLHTVDDGGDANSMADRHTTFNPHGIGMGRFK